MSSDSSPSEVIGVKVKVELQVLKYFVEAEVIGSCDFVLYCNVPPHPPRVYRIYTSRGALLAHTHSDTHAKPVSDHL